MEAFVPAGIALAAAFVAWKALKGFVKVASIVVIAGYVAYLYYQGVI